MVFDGANRPLCGRVRPSKTMVEKRPHRGDAVTRRAEAKRRNAPNGAFDGVDAMWPAPSHMY